MGAREEGPGRASKDPEAPLRGIPRLASSIRPLRPFAMSTPMTRDGTYDKIVQDVQHVRCGVIHRGGHRLPSLPPPPPSLPASSSPLRIRPPRRTSRCVRPPRSPSLQPRSRSSAPHVGAPAPVHMRSARPRSRIRSAWRERAGMVVDWREGRAAGGFLAAVAALRAGPARTGRKPRAGARAEIDPGRRPGPDRSTRKKFEP